MRHLQVKETMSVLAGIRIACAAQLLVVLAVFLLQNRRARGAGFMAGFLIGAIAFLIFPLLEDASPMPFWATLVLWFAMLATPYFFWMLSLTLFDDHFVPKLWHYAVLPAKVLVSIATGWPGRPLLVNVTSEADAELLRLIPAAAFSALLVVLAIIPAVRDLESDLVEWRRRLRVVHIVGTGSILLLVILSRLLLRGPDLGALFGPLSVGLTAAATFGFTLSTMSFRQGIFIEPEGKAAPAETHIDTGLREKLETAFQQNRLYAEEGLTIRILASKLGAQEYRLRRLINGGLKYRNFNDFLNRYRIQEACERLISEPETPVIRVAMDAGYRSLGSFNRAFKDLTGTTPTSYRKEGPRKSKTTDGHR